ncbi:unnamed protein product [Arctogadus glacialis]
MRLLSSLEGKGQLGVHTVFCHVTTRGCLGVASDTRLQGTTTAERAEGGACIWKVQLKCRLQSGADTPELHHNCNSDLLESSSGQQTAPHHSSSLACELICSTHSTSPCAARWDAPNVFHRGVLPLHTGRVPCPSRRRGSVLGTELGTDG